MEQPLISICIPAYKNANYIVRLLDSIRIQTFRDFEVVICDDSPDDQLEEIVDRYQKDFGILYQRNFKALGSPANWNRSIELAQGQWIKIMHDDDWFTRSDSLLKFVKAANESNCDFIFSGFINFNLTSSVEQKHLVSKKNLVRLRNNPLYLFRTNYIGHPSTTLIRNKNVVWFDEYLKWVVDIEFYIRVLNKNKEFFYIPELLVNIGESDDQITKSVFRNPIVEIPENLYLLNKIGVTALRNIYVFDYYWRLIRNLGFRNISDVLSFNRDSLNVPIVFNQILFVQSKFSLKLLKIGVISKTLMFFTWFYNFLKSTYSR